MNAFIFLINLKQNPTAAWITQNVDLMIRPRTTDSASALIKVRRRRAVDNRWALNSEIN